MAGRCGPPGAPVLIAKHYQTSTGTPWSHVGCNAVLDGAGYGPGTSFTEVRAHPLHFLIPGDLTGLQVDPSKNRVVVDEAPDAIADFLKPDIFSLERIAQEILPRVKAKRAARAHSADLEVTGIFGFSKTAGVCFR